MRIKNKLLWAALLFFLYAFPAQAQLFPGEKLTYQIEYLGVAIGESVAEVGAIEDYHGRKVYPIRVRARSYKILDWVYKVRDEHLSLVDAETLDSLYYEKSLHEGRHRAQEKTETPKGMQDAVSCGYKFRTLDLKPDSSVFIPVHAEGKNWNMETKLRKIEPLKIKGVGEFSTLQVEPLMEFQGVFVRRGKIRGWVSLDERRIPVMMKVKIPVLGEISATLKNYEAGQANEKI